MAAYVHRFAAVVTALAALLMLPLLRPAPAQTPAPPAKPEMAENCPGLVAADQPRVIPAALRLAALNPDQVRISYSGHSTFLIESPQQVRIATDYNDYVHPPGVPDIITMNHAHDTHYTDHPDPAIKYVLRGWGKSESEPARHDIQVRDVRVRNVPTNIRNWNGGIEPDCAGRDLQDYAAGEAEGAGAARLLEHFQEVVSGSVRKCVNVKVIHAEPRAERSDHPHRRRHAGRGADAPLLAAGGARGR